MLNHAVRYLRSRAGVGWSCFMSHAEVAGGAVLRNHKLEVRAEVAVSGREMSLL